MKYKIVLCVLIYFELVASHPYGGEYLEANQPPRQRLQFSNLPQPQNVPPGLFNQNAFRTDAVAPTRPFYHNVGSYRAPETGQDLNPPMQQGQIYNNNQLSNQQTIRPVQQPSTNQNKFSNQFMGNQERPQNIPQFPAQYAAVPRLNSVSESYLGPVQKQYQSMERSVENLGQTAGLRPQHYLKEQTLPVMNVHPTPIPQITIQPLHTYHPVEKVNGNVGVKRIVNNQQIVPSNPRITNADVTVNSNLQRIMQNPKIKEILATTKNQKRYMIIHPNGYVEHVDNLENFMAVHPDNFIINAATVNQMMHNLSPVVQPATLPPPIAKAPPLAPEVVPAMPAPLTLPPTIHIPQNPSSKYPVVTSIPGPTEPNVMKQSPLQHSPTTPPIVSPDPSKLKVNFAPSPKLSETNFIHPNVPRVLTNAVPSAAAPSPSETVTTPHLNNLSPPVQLQTSSLGSATNYSVRNPLIDSENNKSPGNTQLHAESMSNDQNAVIKELPAKPLPVAITELSPTFVASNHLTVTPSTVSAKDNTSNQSITSNGLPLNPAPSPSEPSPKPIVMVSPTPSTPSVPIDLADLFPPTNEDTPKLHEVLNSTTSETTGQSTVTSSITSMPSSDSQSNIVDQQLASESSEVSSDNMQSDTKTDEVERTENEVVRTESAAAVNDSTDSFAHQERSDEDEDENESLEISSSKNALSSDKSSQATEVQSEAESEELRNYSANHSDTQEDENAQNVAETVSKTDSSSSDASASSKESSNPDAETTAHNLPSIIMLSTTSTMDSREDSQRSSNIVIAEKDTYEKEGVEDEIRRKKNMPDTLPSYEEIWEKLVNDGLVNVMYFINVPTQNKYEYEYENERDYE